jgi:hypothetical protein
MRFVGRCPYCGQCFDVVVYPGEIEYFICPGCQQTSHAFITDNGDYLACLEDEDGQGKDEIPSAEQSGEPDASSGESNTSGLKIVVKLLLLIPVVIGIFFLVNYYEKNKDKTYTYTDGSAYKGKIKDGFYHGKGTLYRKGMAGCTGIFNRGELVGYGTASSKDEMTACYEKDNEMLYISLGKACRNEEENLSVYFEQVCDQSMGKRIFKVEEYANGDKYEGYIIGGERHGQGKYLFEDASIYDGHWENGQKHGQGKMTYKSGNYYDGEWADGLKHGKGKIYFSNTNRSCIGNYRKGDLVGYGIGSKSKGEYRACYKKNNSITFFNLGEACEDEFRNAKGYLSDICSQHVEQKIYKVEEYADGSKYEGYFFYDKKHGQGKMTYKNGNYYDGEWADDLKYGKGKIYFSNTNSSCTGNYRKDDLVGYGIGSKSKGEYRACYEKNNTITFVSLEDACASYIEDSSIIKKACTEYKGDHACDYVWRDFKYMEKAYYKADSKLGEGIASMYACEDFYNVIHNVDSHDYSCGNSREARLIRKNHNKYKKQYERVCSGWQID